MTAFRPLGTQARWRTIYHDVLTPANVGDLLTYERLAEALDLHPLRDRATIRSALRRAAREYLDEKGRALAPMTGVGYRVVEPVGHMMLARHQQGKAGRALARGHGLTTKVDLSGVDREVRHAFEVMAEAFTLQMDFNRRFDTRQAHLEDAIRATEIRQDRTAEEVEVLQERLRQVEERLGE